MLCFQSSSWQMLVQVKKTHAMSRSFMATWEIFPIPLPCICRFGLIFHTKKSNTHNNKLYHSSMRYYISGHTALCLPDLSPTTTWRRTTMPCCTWPTPSTRRRPLVGTCGTAGRSHRCTGTAASPVCGVIITTHLSDMWHYHSDTLIRYVALSLRHTHMGGGGFNGILM